MTFTGLAKGIDFELLRRQKQLLSALIYSNTLLAPENFSDERQALQGLLLLIDDVMDASVKTLGEKAVFGEAKNDGCLDHLACPKCKQYKKLEIVTTSTTTVVDDGTDSAGGVEWTGLSPATCPECGYHGRIWQFQV